MAQKETVAGRTAVGDLVANNWDSLVSAIEGLPRKARPVGSAEGALGTEGAKRYARTQLRALLDSLNLAAPRTPALARAQHRAHLAFGVSLDVMLRDDRAGAEARVAFLEGCERFLLHPSIRIVYSSSRELGDDAYVPETG